MSSFLRPATLSEALAALAGQPRRLLAGGTDLYPGAGPSLTGDVMAIADLPELRGISRSPREIRIGACTTWDEIAQADLPGGLTALAQAARQVGGWQIQTAGTIGGNLCNASPAADGVPPLLVAGAEAEIAGPFGLRRQALADFLQGPRRVDLRPRELLVAIVLPMQDAAGQSRFLKLGARAHLVISIAMVAVRIVPREGRVAHAAVAVGACTPVAVRLPAVERAFEGRRLDDLASVAMDVSALAPLDDIRATAGYRQEAAAELVRRAVAEVVACC